MFALDAEKLEQVQKWRPGVPVDLLNPEYNLVQIFDDTPFTFKEY